MHHPSGEQAVVGYIYGGIEADYPLPKIPNQGTHATGSCFKVTVKKLPSAAIPAAGNARNAKADVTRNFKP